MTKYDLQKIATVEIGIETEVFERFRSDSRIANVTRKYF
jgi:hypothetical protein